MQGVREEALTMWSRVYMALSTTAAAYNISSDDDLLHLLGGMNLSIAILLIIDLLKQP